MGMRLAAAARNAMCNALVDLVDAGAAAGTIKVYTGSQPTNPDTAASGTLLCTFTLADPAFGAASAGVADLDADPDLSTTAVATGTAGWFRVADSDNNPVFDGVCGTSGQQLNLNTTSITSGGTVTATLGTVTVPLGS